MTTCLAPSVCIIFGTVVRNISLSEHTGILVGYTFPYMKATTCTSGSISKVSVGFDIVTVLFDTSALGTSLVGEVPGALVNG